MALAFTPMASVYAADWYVATNGTGNGTSWADATNSIQGAIDASTAADTVLVSNGVYETGGVSGYPAGTALTNRVAIYKAITVRSKDNDPTNTIIKGYGGSPIHGSNSVRCVYITNGASLIGFTVTNGATFTNYTANTNNGVGGGIWSESTNTVISNCVLTGNAGVRFGGGAYYGTLYNCTLFTNLARLDAAGYSYGAGAYGSTLYNCTVSSNSATGGGAGGGVNGGILYNCTIVRNYAQNYGGGAYGATLYNCTLINNIAGNSGGGAYASTLYNCLLSTNWCGNWGGGARYGTLYNCLLSSNYAYYGGGMHDGVLYNCTVSGNTAGAGGGGGVKGSSLNNSIVYFNTTTGSGSNWLGVTTFTNTCTAPEATNGPGNITSDPLLVNRAAGNYRLNEVSPAINAGTYFAWMTDLADARSSDLDGNNRRDNYRGQVDMGCYEYFFRGTIFTGR
ncbi:MAG: hypothetical protein HYV36_04080 [Lentisphaerae bacterium]|nr:hypothetical protein [Lentisphaerota bacterium]